MKKHKSLILFLLVIVSFGFLRYDSVQTASVNASAENTIKVYSILPEDLTRALLNEYQEKTKTKFAYTLMDKGQNITADGAGFDLIIAPREMMIKLTADGRLLKRAYQQENLSLSLQATDGYWTGFCYDPYVFLVNYAYSRKVGQKNLLSWKDVAKQNDIVISMEDLSTTSEMRYFLSAFASNQGEDETLAFLKNINRKIPQYAKFAISPIRLTTIGEADLAITSRNKVIKYIENDFPAYIVEPAEGFPAQIFAAGIAKASKKAETCEKIINWLLNAEDVIIVSEKLGYGYLFVSQNKFADEENGEKTLWINDNYLSEEKRTELVEKWL
ncbi:MAG: extracellular solute-binding protein, partial [Acidaminococcaceae bacterium]